MFITRKKIVMGIAIANPPDKPVEQYFAKRYSLYDDRLNIFLKNPEVLSFR